MTLPVAHPRARHRTEPLRGFAICHPDGVIVVDTGVGRDNVAINERYRPEIVGLVTALNNAEIDERSVKAIVNTHLHFDHCGQNHVLPSAPVWVTRAEMAAVTSVRDYTVREWADIPLGRLRYAADGEEIADGVRLVATPGHTPGHQSVVVTGFDERPDVIVGQACFNCHEFADGLVEPRDLHDVSLASAARSSLLRLLSLRPSSAYFSHDRRIFASP